MIGTSTPTRRPICGAYMPAALTTTSHSIVPLSVTTSCDASVAQAYVRDPGALLDLRAQRAGAVGKGERQLARIEVAVAREEGSCLDTPFVLIGGNIACASSAETISMGRPKVRAQAA